ncbi:hypothetical protein J43TS9_34030 [Paenibacillus cineris]|nr:hypothetical protein J43TS9_34030 [Paenibacillus cineris]
MEQEQKGAKQAEHHRADQPGNLLLRNKTFFEHKIYLPAAKKWIFESNVYFALLNLNSFNFQGRMENESPSDGSALAYYWGVSYNDGIKAA